MRKITSVALMLGALSLAACQSEQADQVEDTAEAQAEQIDEMADQAPTEAQEEALENKADVVEEQGEEAANKMDDDGDLTERIGNGRYRQAISSVSLVYSISDDRMIAAVPKRIGHGGVSDTGPG